MKSAEAIAGILIVAFTFSEIFRGAVLPRPTYGFSLAKRLLHYSWVVWRRIGLRRRPPGGREAWLGAFAPASVILLLLLWIAGLLLGSALILHALRDQIQPEPDNLGTALYLSGTACSPWERGTSCRPVGWPAPLLWQPPRPARGRSPSCSRCSSR